MRRMAGQRHLEVIVEEEGVRTTVVVAPVSDSAFRVAECVWLVESFSFDDVIELARTQGEEVFRFVRVIRPSALVRTTALLSERAAASPELDALLDEVLVAGGYWERALGGGVFIAMPAKGDARLAERLRHL